MGRVLLIYTCLFGLLIFAEYNKYLKKVHTLFKFLNSLGFIGVASWAAYTSGNWGYYVTMIPGFLFCLGGDVFLDQKNGKHQKIWFMAGLLSFLTGHIAFVWAFHYISPVRWSDIIFPAVMAVAAYFLTKLDGMEMQGATVPVMIYAFFVSLLMFKGISIAVGSEYTERSILLMAGTILFWFSDALILFIIFYRKKYKWSHFINLLTYYYGVFLIAMSIRF